MAEWLRRQTQVLVNFVGVSSILTGCKFFLWLQKKKKKKNLFEARIELATSSVLDWRDNQLHHPNSDEKKYAQSED